MCNIINNLPVIDYLDKRRLPRSTGLYYIVAEDRIIYIGIALDLKGRFCNHHHNKVFKKLKSRIYYQIYNGLDFESLRLLESKAILKYRPCYNERTERGESRLKIQCPDKKIVDEIKNIVAILKEQLLLNDSEILLRALQSLNVARR